MHSKIQTSILKVNVDVKTYNRIVRVTFRNDGGNSDLLVPISLLPKLKARPSSIRLICGKFYIEFRPRSWAIQDAIIRITFADVIDFNKGSVIINPSAINIKKTTMKPNLEKKISSVTLINYGLKGLKAKYITTDLLKGVTYFNKENPERSRPIHAKLEECFMWLKPYLLDIYSYTTEPEERKYLIQSLVITQVSRENGAFKIKGEITTLEGCVLPLDTRAITESAYPDFSKVNAIISAIFEETKEYLAGDKVMEDLDIIAKFHKMKPTFDMDDVRTWSKQKQKEFATKLLEDMGCIVIHNEDIDVAHAVDATEPVTFSEPDASYTVPDEPFSDSEATLSAEVSTDTNSDSTEIKPQAFDGGGFSLGIPPAPEKVARKK